jgi:hypothetical protein
MDKTNVRLKWASGLRLLPMSTPKVVPPKWQRPPEAPLRKLDKPGQAYFRGEYPLPAW